MVSTVGLDTSHGFCKYSMIQMRSGFVNSPSNEVENWRREVMLLLKYFHICWLVMDGDSTCKQRRIMTRLKDDIDIMNVLPSSLEKGIMINGA